MEFEGKIAIVTGAAQGIGVAIVRELVSKGAKVMACDVQKDKVESAAAQIREEGWEVAAFGADLTQPEEAKEMVRQTIETFGRIDILVNNAGGSGNVGIDHIEDVSEDLWDFIIDSNLKSAFLCCRAITPHLKENSYGKIINFSSGSARGTFGPRGTSAARLPYAGAKAGVDGFTKQLAKDLAPWGINVNAIMPGFILTESDARVAKRYEELTKGEQKDMWDRVPMGRPGKPEEIAKVAAFLASDDSSFVSGAIIEVTGAG